MKSIKTIVFPFLFLLTFNSVFGQLNTVSSGRISISVLNVLGGLQLHSISDNGTELLDTTRNEKLFKLTFRNTLTSLVDSLTAESNWGSATVTNNGNNMLVEFSNPGNGLPTSTKALLTITTNDEASTWDLSVSGLDSVWTLMEVEFPKIDIKAVGNDKFFIPYYAGKVIDDPASNLDYYDDLGDPWDDRVGRYPRGWGCTMQYMAYYNATYGVYMGFHDPKASHKKLGAKGGQGHILVNGRFPVPNKTIAGNSWDMPGHFQLDMVDGDWYDAALHYKSWASSAADFWPQDSLARRNRQESIGAIGVWAYNYLNDLSGNLGAHSTGILTFANFMESPVGIHLYRWNYLPFDDDYPNYFPERTGLDTMVNNTQGANSNIFLMPYINGRMFDTDLMGYPTHGLPYATKRENGNIYFQVFNSNTFAVMCPTQAPWQDTLSDAAAQLTSRIGTAGVYIDQVGAASPAQCMDSTHGHPIGGGHYWRGGYNEMFEKIHSRLDSNKFITVEGGCDFLVDEVDGFMVQGWTTDHQVPAFSAVYSGQVQLFGTQTGTSHYGDQQFYGKLAQGFNFGIQTGRVSLWLAYNLANANADRLMAADYVKSLGKMRNRLKDFMSFGEMRRPLDVVGSIPTLSYSVNDAGTSTPVMLPAIQTSTWQQKDSVVVVFANSRIQSPAGTAGGVIPFSFQFVGTDYGLGGNLTVQIITPTTDSTVLTVGNTFSRNVDLPNLGLVAYLIKGHPAVNIDEAELPTLNIYPNPTHTSFSIDCQEEGPIKVSIYNNLGQLVLEKVTTNKVVNVANIPGGIYTVSIWLNEVQHISKLIKQ